MAYPTDLSDPAASSGIAQGWNTIGLTGAAHTMELYRRLPDGWTEPPPGWWSDHYFWGQIFGLPDVRLTTSHGSTVIKPPSALRAGDPRTPGGPLSNGGCDASGDQTTEMNGDGLVADAVRRSAVTDFMSTTQQSQDHCRTAGDDRASTRDRIEAARVGARCSGGTDRRTGRVSGSRIDAAAHCAEQLELIMATRTWRLRNTLLRLGPLRTMLARHGST